EEGQAHRQAAEAGNAGIATERRYGLRVGQLGDRDVQVVRQRACRRQTGGQVVGVEGIDETGLGEMSGGQLRVYPDRLAGFVYGVQVEVDADSLEEVLGDADEPDFDGHFLIDQPPQGAEEILDLVLDVRRLVDR